MLCQFSIQYPLMILIVEAEIPSIPFLFFRCDGRPCRIFLPWVWQYPSGLATANYLVSIQHRPPHPLLSLHVLLHSIEAVFAEQRLGNPAGRLAPYLPYFSESPLLAFIHKEEILSTQQKSRFMALKTVVCNVGFCVCECFKCRDEWSTRVTSDLNVGT